MLLHISPDRTLGELQADFSAAFPGLKLVFFSKPHRAYKGSFAKFLLDQLDQSLQALSPTIKTGSLLVQPDMPVWQLEQLLEEGYGLHVQVFRKSGQSWLETSVTDGLTLAQQQAKTLAVEHTQEAFDYPLDYREQD